MAAAIARRQKLNHSILRCGVMMASLHFSHDRLKFFVRPVVPQDTLFFLLEETDPSASVVLLAAVNPKASWRHGARNMLFNCGPMLGTHALHCS